MLTRRQRSRPFKSVLTNYLSMSARIQKTHAANVRAKQEAEEWMRKHEKSDVWKTYCASDRGATRRLLASLRGAGPKGRIAAGLLKAMKASSRAKKYRGGYRHDNGDVTEFSKYSYRRKQAGLKEVCLQLELDPCGMTWGWGTDSKNAEAPHVLYIDLPQGQVAFHSTKRYAGPNYSGKKSAKHSERRVISFCHDVFESLTTDT